MDKDTPNDTAQTETTEITIPEEYMKLLRDADSETAKAQQVYGNMVSAFFRAPNVKAAEENLARSETAFMRLCGVVLKQLGIEGEEIARYNLDLDSGTVKLKNPDAN